MVYPAAETGGRIKAIAVKKFFKSLKALSSGA
jgi:hypothetical protein